MKAIVYTQYGPPDVLKFSEIDKPVPKENEVLVKIAATTVTAVDSIFRKGNTFFARMATGVFKPKAPVLGSEFSGVVEAVGGSVARFKTGDLVFGDSSDDTGTHQEYICLPEDGVLAHKPANLDLLHAAAIPYGALTALPFLRDHGHIQSGQRVLVVGASGAVGTVAVQLAKYYGAHVTGVCSSVNTELVKSLGADSVIDYSKEDFTQSGQTWDIVFDTVGKTSYTHCKKVLTVNGIYLTTFVSFSILWHMLRTAKSRGKKAAIAFTGLRPVKDRARDLEFVKQLFELGRLEIIIDEKYPFEHIVKAYAYVDQGHKKGNVVITMGNAKTSMPFEH